MFYKHILHGVADAMARYDCEVKDIVRRECGGVHEEGYHNVSADNHRSSAEVVGNVAACTNLHNRPSAQSRFSPTDHKAGQHNPRRYAGDRRRQSIVFTCKFERFVNLRNYIDLL